MLVLSRKKGESIQIADDVFVEVLRIRGDKVRLGITAPRTVKVVRKELLDAVPSGEECVNESVG